MQKYVLTGLLVAMMSAALVVFATEVPETITIDDCADKKAAVEFPHKAHFEVTECVTCHHTSEGLTLETCADMEVATCASCHVAPEEEGVPACGEMSLKKNPFHISCIGCHKDHVKENAESTAPTKCNDCHPKG